MITPHAYEFACPFCSAAPQHKCVTASGKELNNNVHRARWDYRMMWLRGLNRFVVTILEDDPAFNLTAGENYVAQIYPYDAKVTLLARIPDGWNPECNLYPHQGQFVRLATPEDLKTLGKA